MFLCHCVICKTICWDGLRGAFIAAAESTCGYTKRRPKQTETCWWHCTCQSPTALLPHRCLQHFRRYSRWSRSLVVLDVDDGLPHILYRDLFSWSLHCAAYSEANQNRKKVRRKIVKDVGAVVKCQHQKNVSFMKRGSTDVIYVSNVSGKSESTSVQNYQRNNRRPTTFSV